MRENSGSRVEALMTSSSSDRKNSFSSFREKWCSLSFYVFTILCRKKCCVAKAVYEELHAEAVSAPEHLLQSDARLFWGLSHALASVSAAKPWRNLHHLYCLKSLSDRTSLSLLVIRIKITQTSHSKR